VHACTHESLGVPETPAAAFALLERNGVVWAALSARLARAAGLRNLIMHRYGDLDAAKPAQAIAGGLGDLEEFAAALRTRAGLAPTPSRQG